MSELNIFSVLARSRQSVGKAKRVSQRRDRSGLGRLGSGYAFSIRLCYCMVCSFVPFSNLTSRMD